MERFSLQMQKIRDHLFPRGTLRDRAFSVWEREGFSEFLKRGSSLVFRKIQQLVFLRFGNSEKNVQFIPLPELPQPQPGKVDIICFSVIQWGFRFQRPQQILSQFANDGHRIFYVSPKFGGFNNLNLRVESISDRIFELTLPGDDTLAMYRDDLGNLTLSYSTRALHEFIRHAKITNAICMLHHPFWMPLAHLLKEQYGWKIVYDCMDNVSGFEVANSKIIALENELVSESDLIVATSQSLYQRLHEENSNCILVPNAADYNHFSDLPPHSESHISKISQPIIGYFGAISEWFDIPVIRHAAIEHPEWSFVLIGDTWGANIKSLKKLPNIHLLGEKPYSDLPYYLTGFDVALIPFLRNPLTEATNPVKVFEYLSAGKPVVATSLPELQQIKDLVLLYTTPDEFVANVELALKTNGEDLIEKRQMFARENTWEKRYQIFKRSIEML